ncbi:MAG: DUF429 domain-containing protein [Fimbriimonadaceae bacterium]
MLGIDAAWTLKGPSGVAVAQEATDGWRLVAVESSYERFNSLVGESTAPDRPSATHKPEPAKLLTTAAGLCGQSVDLVAVDMPLSHAAITCRRVSDNMVSQAYGALKCSTHSPSADRPGQISDDLRRSFEELGYPIVTKLPARHGLIEVYPHPALIELTNAPERLPYKAGKSRVYWKHLAPAERRAEVLRVWECIISRLETHVSGVQRALQDYDQDTSGKGLKSTEDRIDAVVCAWVAICALDDRAKPYGDDESAIWIPACLDR